MSYTIRDLINNNTDENIAITSENNNVIKYSDLNSVKNSVNKPDKIFEYSNVGANNF